MVSLNDLVKLLKDDEKVMNINNFSEDVLKAEFGEDFVKMKGYNQNNPYHCYDLLVHTLKTVCGIKKPTEDKSKDAKKREKEYNYWVDLRIAALFHDIGKPNVRAEKEGRSVYYNHADESAEVAENLLSKICSDDKKRAERIIFFIKYHDAFISIKDPESDKGQKSVIKIINNCIDEWENRKNNHFHPNSEDFLYLLKLCEADDKAKKDIVKNDKGEVIDSIEDKKKRIAAIKTIIADNKNEIIYADKNRSFICVPFKFTEKLDMEKLIDMLNSDTIFENMDECKSKILKYVAGRFNCSVDEKYTSNTVCAVRKIKVPDLMTSFSYGKKCKPENNFSLEGLYLFCFNTQINILVEEIKFESNNYTDISNKLFSLRNIGNEEGAIFSREKENCSFTRRGFHESLIDSIIHAINNNNCNLCASIIDTYSNERGSQYVNILTYLRCTEAYYKKHNEDLMFHLSHCYKDEIRRVEGSGDKTLSYVNNNNSIWGITPYATACIAFPNGHNKHFYKQISRDYLLTYVIAISQKYTLYSYLESIPGELKDTEDAKNLRKKLYEFEMDCNFKTISELPQYQNIYKMMCEAFNINGLVTDVKEPLEAYDGILSEEEKVADEKREKRINISLLIISLLAIWSALVDSWDFLGEFKNSWTRNALFNDNLVQTIFFIVTVVIFIVGLGFLLPGVVKDIIERIKNKKRKKK